MAKIESRMTPGDMQAEKQYQRMQEAKELRAQDAERAERAKQARVKEAEHERRADQESRRQQSVEKDKGVNLDQMA